MSEAVWQQTLQRFGGDEHQASLFNLHERNDYDPLAFACQGKDFALSVRHEEERKGIVDEKLGDLSQSERFSVWVYPKGTEYDNKKPILNGLLAKLAVVNPASPYATRPSFHFTTSQDRVSNDFSVPDLQKLKAALPALTNPDTRRDVGVVNAAVASFVADQLRKSPASHRRCSRTSSPGSTVLTSPVSNSRSMVQHSAEQGLMACPRLHCLLLPQRLQELPVLSVPVMHNP